MHHGSPPFVHHTQQLQAVESATRSCLVWAGLAAAKVSLASTCGPATPPPPAGRPRVVNCERRAEWLDGIEQELGARRGLHGSTPTSPVNQLKSGQPVGRRDGLLLASIGDAGGHEPYVLPVSRACDGPDRAPQDRGPGSILAPWTLPPATPPAVIDVAGPRQDFRSDQGAQRAQPECGPW